jgi:hypothetical protein
MRLRQAIFVGVVASVVAPFADADTLPEGWQETLDGGYAHAASGITCAKQIGTFGLTSLEGHAAPNVLGTCIYSGGELRIGKLRVRRYVEGAGETPLAIRNDEVLMHPERQPADQRAVFAERAGPGPGVAGTRTQQLVMTFVSHGFLVDCIVQGKHDDFDYLQKGFLDICPGT